MCRIQKKINPIKTNFMEKSPYKNRSVSSCMAEGYKLYRRNMGNILKAGWKENAAASLSAGLLIVAIIRMTGLAGIVVPVFSAILFLIFLFLYERKIFAMLSENPMKWSIKNIMRHSSLAVSMLLLSSMILLVTIAVACIPLAIAATASAMDNVGMAGGDASGMPEYFNILLYAVSAITIFAVLHMQAWQTFAACFVHGAAETMEKER